MVVIESNSMQHDENGEVGSIDAGDLVLSDQNEKTSFTFVSNRIERFCRVRKSWDAWRCHHLSEKWWL